jgi:hypothetical protein
MWEQAGMLTLISYPGLFGLADNNPYGLKIFAVLRGGFQNSRASLGATRNMHAA